MNKFRSRFGIAFVLIAVLASCASPNAPSNTQTSPSYWPTDGWRAASPEEQGMDSELLAQMTEHIQKEQLDLHSLLIVRNGYLVSEIYGYPYSADQVHWIASVTKSVVGALIGIAIEQGYIKDVHQPLSRLIPDSNVSNLDESKKAITLEDLLTLTAGLECQDNPDIPMMEASNNWVDFVLNLPMATKPGTQFNYCTGVVHVLSAILQKATGMSTREFANHAIFSQIGIGPIPETRWPSDPQGVTLGGYGLALTPQEMAKFGYLILNHGKWDGKAIIPADWVSASTTRHTQKDDGKDYGYLWTIDPHGKYYSALGRGGQHIFVFPDENMLVVFTAGLPPGNNADLIPLQELLDQYILPAVKSNGPLPANPKSLARLEAGIQTLAQPGLISQSLPPMAAEISDKKFTLDENPFGLQTIVFSFKEGAKEATATLNDANPLPIGLDNAYRIIDGGDSPFSEGLRGRWENQNTFVVDDVVIGEMVQFEYRIQFSGDTIHLIRHEKYSGNEVEFQGALEH
jgi:CubicO group peptidase (beta-lactamase class C family)